MRQKKLQIQLVLLVLMMFTVIFMGVRNVHADSKSAVVTKDNFYDYFDSDGEIMNTIEEDQLIFKGSFEGLDVDSIILSQSITVTSDKAVLKNLRLYILKDEVTVDGITFDYTGSGSVIYVKDANCVTLTNNKIKYTAVLEDGEDYKPLLVEGAYEDGLTEITVAENEFDLSLPSMDVEYDSNTWLPTIKTAGIEFKGCSGVDFYKNEVNLKTTEKVTEYGFDTVYGVLFLSTNEQDSEDSYIVKENTIKATGESYIYGIDAQFSFEDDYMGDSYVVDVEDNDVTVSGLNTYGISFSTGPVGKGNIINNNITLNAEVSAKAIFLYQYMGAIDNINITSNDLVLEAPECVGIYNTCYGPLDISENTISETGNYLLGISVKSSEGSEISNNIINVEGTNEGDVIDGYYLYRKDNEFISCGIYCYKNDNNTIEENTIITTGVGIASESNSKITDNRVETTYDYAIDTAESSSVVTGNYLIAKDTIADDAVLHTEAATVQDNLPKERPNPDPEPEPTPSPEPTPTPAPTDNTSQPLAKGKTFKVGKDEYKVTVSKAGAAEVAYNKNLNKKAKSKTIKATVKYQGVTYKVTSISPKAFYKNQKLGKIIIKSKTIKKVGNNAVKGIKKKAVIKVPKSKLKKYKKLFNKKTGFKKPMKIKK